MLCKAVGYPCLVLVVLFAAACGSGGGSTGAVFQSGQDVTGISAHTTAPPAGSNLTAIPDDEYVDPAEIIARRESYLEEHPLDGAAFRFSGPEVTPEGGLVDLRRQDWVIYRFEDVVAMDDPLGIRLVTEDTPDEIGSVYLGIADYGTGTWNWVAAGPLADGMYADIPADTEAISPGGRVYAAVYSLADEEISIESVQLILENNRPVAPEGLSASTGLLERVDVSWAPIEGAVGYILEYRMETAGLEPAEWTVLTEQDASDPCAYTHELALALESPSVSCGYRIKAVSAVGQESEYSTAVTGIDRLGMVTGFSATDGTIPTKIAVSWERHVNADSYVIDYRPAGGDEDWVTLLETKYGSLTSFGHDGYFPVGHESVFGGSYEYRIRVVRGGEVSSIDTVTDTGYRPEALLDFTATECHADRIDLAWSGLDFGTGTLIEYRNLDGGSPDGWTELLVAEGTSGGFSHTVDNPPGLGCASDTTYEYRAIVKQYNEVSPQASTALGSRSLAGTPGDFTASDAETGAVSLSWTPLDSADGYLVEYCNAGEGEPADWTELILIEDPTVGGLKHTLDSPPGREAEMPAVYDYRIKAYSGSAWSPRWVVDRGWVRLPVWPTSGGDHGRCRCSLHEGPGTGELLWAIPAGNGDEPAIGVDGILYLDDGDYFEAVSPEGEVLWSVEHPATPVFDSTPDQLSNGELIWADRNLVMRIKLDGQVAWELRGVYADYGPILPAGLMIYLADDSMSIRKVSSAGIDEGQITLTEDAFMAGTVAPDGSLLYRSQTGRVFKLDPATDTVETLNLSATGTTGVVVDEGGTVYVPSYEGTVVASDLAGNELWRYDTGESILASPAVGRDGTVYVADAGGWLYAINGDGTPAWSVPIGVCKSSPVVDAAGKIYLACGSGFTGYDRIMAYNPDGSLAWFLTCNHEFEYSSPVIGLDHRLYIASQDGYLLAVGESE